MKPMWLVRKERDRADARAIQRQRLQLLFRIKDLCWDIDIWRDQRPGSEFEAAKERLGVRPSLAVLQSEYAQLLRIASLRARMAETLEEVAV